MNAIVFKPTGEVRPPKKGELYKLDDEVRYAWEDGYISRSILTRHEIEATPDVLRALGMESVQSKKKALQLSLKHPSDFFSPLLALLFGVFVAVLFGFGVLYLLRNS